MGVRLGSNDDHDGLWHPGRPERDRRSKRPCVNAIEEQPSAVDSQTGRGR